MAGFTALKSLNEKTQSQLVLQENEKENTKNKYIFMWWRLHADKTVIEPICDMSSMPLIDFTEQSQWRQAFFTRKKSKKEISTCCQLLLLHYTKND